MSRVPGFESKCYTKHMETESIVLGGGCFWCTEAVFLMLKGVVSVEPGYAGGHTKNPTYEEVTGSQTGHIEVINIVYHPELLSFEEILQVFFASHDPTTLNQQGADVGPQYQSAIFYTTDAQKQKSEHYIAVLGATYVAAGKSIVTKIIPLDVFYKAEDYHKNYYERNKSAGYCQLVIAPKVEKVEEKFKHLLKE